MTVRDYKSQCIKSAEKNGQSKQAGEQLYLFLEDCLEIWSNSSCLGYLIYALEQLGYYVKEIGGIVNAVKENFGVVSVEEAEVHYQNSRY